MVLGNLGIENTALGFVAGFTGEEIVRRIEQMGVTSDLIAIANGISRINLKLKSIDGTEINGCGPEIGEKDIRKMMEKLDGLEKGDVLALAGSIPSSMPDDMYGKIMERLTGKGIMIIVDATRDLLVNVLKYHPFLVKPNNHELGEIFGKELRTRAEVIPYAKKCRRWERSTYWCPWREKEPFWSRRTEWFTMLLRQKASWSMAWAREIPWWPGLLPAGWKKQIMDSLLPWE